MSVVWKYELGYDPEPQTVVPPRGARIVSAAMQDGRPCVWMALDPDRPTSPQVLRLAATGQEWADPGDRTDGQPVHGGTWEHAATFHHPEAGLVWHVLRMVEA